MGDSEYYTAQLRAIAVQSGTASRLVTGPTLPSMPSGTEFVWHKTDGNGTLLDIISGKVA